MALDTSKYTKEELQKAAESALCYSDIFRNLGLKINGGSYKWLKKTLKTHEISTSHFAKRSAIFIQAGIETSKKRAAVIFSEDNVSNGERRASRILRNFLKFKGITELCVICGINEWNGRLMRLDIDHIDGDCTNNSINNLQFVCPNCHRQKSILI